MKTELYIDDKLVDCSEKLSIPFVYQLEDTNNPTIVKNSFTKTITIQGTKNNDKIFGNIYNFDRKQLYSDVSLTGIYFNPSYRTPFKLYNGETLVESGYMQLNAITLKNNTVNYEITLYGGLGDFFYNLSHNDEREPLTLSDLVYGVKDSDGNVINPENEMDFKINADFVHNCWNKLDQQDFDTIENYITFIPSYNGLYENFDNDKVIINTHNCNAFTTTATTQDGTQYTTYNGYALAELNKELTEWEIRDLRSYMQRPALKLNKLLKAIADPQNNGGYTVEFDKDFFNAGNPYYMDSYIALPLFTSLLDSDGGSIKIEEVSGQTVNSIRVGYINNSIVSGSNTNIITKNNDGIITTNNTDIDCVNVPRNGKLMGSIDLQLFFSGNSTQSELYDYCTYTVGSGKNMRTYKHYHNVNVQLVAYDAFDDSVIAYSNIYSFSNEGDSTGINNITPPVKAPITHILGKWEYDSGIQKHYFKSNADGNTFRIEINNIPQKANITYKLYIFESGVSSLSGSNGIIGGLYNQRNYVNVTPTVTNGIFSPSILSNNIKVEYPEGTIYSDTQITKQSLLKTENTPADYLLSYCKLFGLYFSKDINSKTIKIQQRNNFFKNEIVDWSDRIDYKKDIKINPILFDHKFYRMNLKNTDGYYDGKYKNEYGVEYGQKRINTAYNFNGSTNDLLKDNVFENSVPALCSSQYFRLYYNNNGVLVPSFMVDGISYKLFKETTDELKSTNIEMPSNINIKKTVDINTKSGYDLFAKQTFFTMDNGQKSLNDINSCLLFFNGFVTQFRYNEEGEEIDTVKYYLTDDTSEMLELNDKKPCYIYTESSFDKINQFIGYEYESLPQFLSYKTSLNNVTDSFDFAVPKEIFIHNTNYDDTTTIFNRYWNEFYNDQLNINTKKIACYVNLQGINVNAELLKQFYYFGNSIWLLNKIENYDPNNIATTKCEFIKVQNIDNYVKKIGIDNDFLTVKNDRYVNYNAGEIEITINSSKKWKVNSIYNNNITSISPMTGESGTTIVKVKYSENTSYDEVEYSFAITYVENQNVRYNIYFYQKPNPLKAVLTSGIVKWDNGGNLPSPVYVQAQPLDESALYYARVRVDDYTGKYSCYVPRNIFYKLQVLANIEYNEDLVYSKSYVTSDTIPFTRNIVVPYRTTPLTASLDDE